MGRVDTTRPGGCSVDVPFSTALNLDMALSPDNMPTKPAVASFLGPLTSAELSGRIGRALASTFSFVMRLTAAAPTDGRLQRDFFLEKQSQTSWCWAAVGVAINRFFGHSSLTQCALVQNTLKPADVNCCQSPNADACNRTSVISAVLAAVGVARLAAPQQPQPPVGFDILQHDIARNRPIICAMSGGGTNHFVVVVAWATLGNVPYVFVDDPAVGGRKERPLTTFQDNFDGRQWVQTTRLQ